MTDLRNTNSFSRFVTARGESRKRRTARATTFFFGSSKTRY